MEYDGMRWRGMRSSAEGGTPSIDAARLWLLLLVQSRSFSLCDTCATDSIFLVIRVVARKELLVYELLVPIEAASRLVALL